MRRKEIKARTITQGNDASCYGRPNGRPTPGRFKRNASKRLRQALKREDKSEEP